MNSRVSNSGRDPVPAESALNDPQVGAWPCLTQRGSGCRLSVTVVPQARRTGPDGLHDRTLRIRLAAPPRDGEANEALIHWLSQALGVPKRAVRIAHGASSRRKQLDIDQDIRSVAQWLQRLPQ